MITDGMLALARGDMDLLMGSAANVVRTTATPDGIGGSTSSESTVISGAACHIGQPANARERELAERLGLTQAVTVTFPYGTDVRAGDRVEAGGRRLRVVQALSTGDRALAARFMCSEMV